VVNAQSSLKIAKLKYGGGGDWYANKTSLPNLIKFCNAELKMNINPVEDVVEVGSPDIFAYPFVHMTGHGNVVFTDAEAQNCEITCFRADFCMWTITMAWISLSAGK
jgi:hypothetical protein